MKKLIIFTAAILLFATRAFAQETSERDYVDEKDMSVTEVEELIQSKGLIHRLDFVFGIEPTVSINTHKKNSQGKFISAPSPVSIPVYIGLSIPNYTPVSFQPSLRFFTGYNLVYDNMVLPAEVENRTGQTLSFLLNLPVVFKLNYKPTLLAEAPKTSKYMIELLDFLLAAKDNTKLPRQNRPIV